MDVHCDMYDVVCVNANMYTNVVVVVIVVVNMHMYAYEYIIVIVYIHTSVYVNDIGDVDSDVNMYVNVC